MNIGRNRISRVWGSSFGVYISPGNTLLKTMDVEKVTRKVIPIKRDRAAYVSSCVIDSWLWISSWNILMKTKITKQNIVSAPERSSVIDSPRNATFSGCFIFNEGFLKRLSGIFLRLADFFSSSWTVILVFSTSMKMALERHFSIPSIECRIVLLFSLINTWASWAQKPCFKKRICRNLTKFT